MTHLLDLIIDTEEHEANASRMPGVVVGVVTNNEDPDGLGRVKVKFPWLSDEDESNWARVATPMAGKDRGIYFLPEVGDEVLLAFAHGDVRIPFVVGALWNGEDAPPVTNDGGSNNVRLIKSRSGHTIRLNDEDGSEKIEIVDMSEKNSIVIDTATNSITITSDKDITLSAAQGKITLDAQEVAINSSAATQIEAGSSMDVKSSATMTIKGSTVNIN
jgi:uncharacterized protein involved in type VI secretion and phage assembly